MPNAQHLPALIGALVSANSRLVRVAATATGSEESPAVWRTLGVLRDLGPLRLGELARVSRVTQPTMTKLVNALEERRWVRRTADPDDGRALRVAAEPLGLAALDAWREELTAAIAPLFPELDSADLAALERTVAVLEAGLDRADASVGRSKEHE
ncbi:MarR family transcriptional regulator [Agromyces mediolanus]|uniref:MarR family winged helix-turn-helix transcriptional regulator n=1 Tax=Agromyces mediolanus TaxID=41986 RepID=UPI0038358D02